MNIYTGCAIDNNSAAEEQYDQLISVIDSSIKEQKVIFRPKHAFRLGGNITGKESEFIYGVNMAALAKSDLAIFWLTGAFSFGVPIEIHYCHQRLIPHVLLWTSAQPPGSYVKLFCTDIVYDMGELATYLESVNTKLPGTNAGHCPPSFMGD